MLNILPNEHMLLPSPTLHDTFGGQVPVYYYASVFPEWFLHRSVFWSSALIYCHSQRLTTIVNAVLSWTQGHCVLLLLWQFISVYGIWQYGLRVGSSLNISYFLCSHQPYKHWTTAASFWRAAVFFSSPYSLYVYAYCWIYTKHILGINDIWQVAVKCAD